MRRTILGIALSCLVAAPGLADIAPIEPPPSPPSGPEEATIRGLGVRQVYAYWRGRHWFTQVTACETGGGACEAAGCYVTAANGRPLQGGDVAALVLAAKTTPQGDVVVTLDNCAITEMSLPPQP